MNHSKRWLIMIVATGLVLAAGIALALFTNGDFESGTFSGWTQSAFLNYGLTNGPNGPFTGTNIVRTVGGANQSAIVTASGPEMGVDPKLGATATLKYPKFGLNCARVNGTTVNNVSNSLLQQSVVSAGDVDPVDNLVHIRFAYAPVLQNPAGHNPSEQPFFYIAVRSVVGSTKTLLWETFVFSGEAGVPWKISPLDPGIKYLDWRLVDLAPGNTLLPVGTTIELEVIGADCSQGGHFGYVYVDGFGSEIPGLAVSKTANLPRVVPGSNLVYTFNYKNGGVTSVNNVVVTENIPTCATYVSSTNPSTGGTTSYSSGIVTASIGTLAATTAGTFTVTVQASSDIQTCPSIDNGNYAIAGDGVSPTLGPPVSTPLNDLCTPATSLQINSGWEQATGAQLAVGAVDNEWMVISDPSIFVNTHEPRPAFVITPNAAWSAAQPNSQWVSSFPTSVNDTNGHYVFEYRFCLQSNQNAFLNLSLRADDQATVFLNGNNMGFTGAHSFNLPPLVVATTAADFGKFNTGDNVITVDVENTNSVAMGFNLVGTITGQIPLYHYCCTDSASGVLGKVWNDPNKNKVQDSGESGVENRIVRLYRGATLVATTLSDGLGNYYFMDQVPGTYKVVCVPVFLQTFTTALSYTVTLDLGQIVPDKNFGVKAFDWIATGWDKKHFDRQPFEPFVRPNPFNPETSISLTLKNPMHVSMKIYDVEGRLVESLVDENVTAGDHKWTWDGRNNFGQTTASGIYFLRTVTPLGVNTQKLILLK